MTDIDQIIADIARQQLRIETLETRKSDSLDFHDVSVWGLRTALLCAFEAGRKSVRAKPKVIETGKTGTCYRGSIEASYQDLVEVWGEPSKVTATKRRPNGSSVRSAKASSRFTITKTVALMPTNILPSLRCGSGTLVATAPTSLTACWA